MDALLCRIVIVIIFGRRCVDSVARGCQVAGGVVDVVVKHGARDRMQDDASADGGCDADVGFHGNDIGNAASFHFQP